MARGPYNTASFLASEKHVVDSCKVASYVSSLAVEASARGRGLAKELMERAFRAVEQKGSELIYLHVMASNTAAIRLYEKLGYTKEAEVPRYYTLETTTEDGLLFVKRDIKATLLSWGNE